MKTFNYLCHCYQKSASTPTILFRVNLSKFINFPPRPPRNSRDGKSKKFSAQGEIKKLIRNLNWNTLRVINGKMSVEIETFVGGRRDEAGGIVFVINHKYRLHQLTHLSAIFRFASVLV